MNDNTWRLMKRGMVGFVFSSLAMSFVIVPALFLADTVDTDNLVCAWLMGSGTVLLVTIGSVAIGLD